MPDSTESLHRAEFEPHPAVLHVLQTLPDSLRLRRELLDDCATLLPEGDPLRRHVEDLLDLLEMHERLQLRLSIGIVAP